MNHDERVRRFIDDELSAEQRRELLAEAERDLGLSTALLRAQEQRAQLAQLSSMTQVGPTAQEHVQRILQRASAARQAQDESPWRFLRALWLPRFRMSLGGVLVATLAAASIALAVATQLRRIDPVPSTSAPPTRPASDRQAREPELAAADVHRSVAVRFMLPAVGAKSVSVVGDFNAWRSDAAQLDDADGDGVFVTTLLLPRGSYSYMFVIDGERWTTDPYATNYRDDGFGQRNAVIRVN